MSSRELGSIFVESDNQGCAKEMLVVAEAVQVLANVTNRLAPSQSWLVPRAIDVFTRSEL